MDKGVQYTMDSESKYHGLSAQYTLDRRFAIPCGGGQNTIDRGQNDIDRGLDIPWNGKA